jgi:hypothetical protein
MIRDVTPYRWSVGLHLPHGSCQLHLGALATLR